ncbi:MAG: alcohol dehydrogenase catalytic domain-containing protein, partial [Kiritimatiellae bacterium]|nr:alcohol dehydrogenase catalytic domain-containing protein [Kiritimatiellia bacterium]
MKALVFDGELRLDPDYPDPAPRPGWAVIRVRQAGICRTDLEITRGYMSFRGVLGHEFVGTVSACSDADRVGQRVVGEINAACGACDWCRRGMGRHCPRRTTLGILNLDGCMAEYCALPVANLHAVPPEIPDDRAVFVEPLSAACEILDQVQVESGMRCVVVGDGKLGILCAWVLATVSSDVTLVGHHREHLEAAEWGGVKTTVGTGGLTPGADVVVEASGSENGLMESIGLCRPRGTLVLKSTVATQGSVNLAP